MRLVTATVIVDRLARSPYLPVQTTFTEAGTQYKIEVGTDNIARLTAPGKEPFERPVGPRETTKENREALAEWITFVVDMNSVISDLTNA